MKENHLCYQIAILFLSYKQFFGNKFLIENCHFSLFLQNLTFQPQTYWSKNVCTTVIFLVFVKLKEGKLMKKEL